MGGSVFYVEGHTAEASMGGAQGTVNDDFADLKADLEDPLFLGALKPEDDINAFIDDFNQQVNPDGSLKQ